MFNSHSFAGSRAEKKKIHTIVRGSKSQNQIPTQKPHSIRLYFVALPRLTKKTTGKKSVNQPPHSVQHMRVLKNTNHPQISNYTYFNILHFAFSSKSVTKKKKPQEDKLPKTSNKKSVSNRANF